MSPVRTPHRFFQSILCPIDFSTPSRVALQHADAVARRTGGTLTVMYADDPMLAAAAAAGYDRKLLTRQTTTAVRRLLSRIGVPLDEPSHSPAIVCAIGRPAAEILKAVRRNKSDLIVMGTQGRTGVGRMFFGSVTDRVLRTTTVPVLAVPPGVSARALKSWPGERILCAVEFGPRVSEDVHRAAAVAQLFGAALTLLHVVVPTSGPPWVRKELRMYDRSRLKDARRKLDELGRAARSVAGRVESRVLFGNPADRIAATASEVGARLIVLTLRKGHGLFGRRQGAITYQVLCGGAVPVLALRQTWQPDRNHRATRAED